MGVPGAVVVLVSLAFVLGGQAPPTESPSPQAQQIAGATDAPEQAQEAARQHRPPQPGEQVPDFTLTDTLGNEMALSAVLADPETTMVVLEWWSPECVFINKHHNTFKTMVDLEAEFRDQGVRWLAINSSSEKSGLHDPELCESRRQEYGMEYPVLLDTDGAVARLLGAKVTPHMFVIDKDSTLVYVGSIDSNARERFRGDRNFVREAIVAHLSGTVPERAALRAYGCAIKF